MKDIFGYDLEVGDKVMYVGRTYKEFQFGIILALG